MNPTKLKEKIKALLIELKYPFFYTSIFEENKHCFDYYKVQAWLREKHNIHCNPEIIQFRTNYSSYMYKIHYNADTTRKLIISDIIYDDYETSLNHGIYESLKIIKNGNKV